MPHREPRPDPRQEPRQRPQAPSKSTNPPPSGKPPTRQPPTEPGDFLGLGMELSAISRRGGSSGSQENGAGLMPQQQQPQSPPIPPRMLETTTFRPRVDAHPTSRPTQPPRTLQPGSNPSGADTSITKTPGVARSQPANPNLPNLSATGTHLRYLGNMGTGSPGASNPGAPNAGTPHSIAPHSGTSGPITPPSPSRAIPPPPSPTTVSAMMQPMAFEVLPPDYEQKPVRTNSWLLALDDARAGRAGAEPVVADPSDLRRAPRVARPLDTSFSEPEPVTRRSAPWLVGLLLGVAACSLVFVFWSTLTHVDPKSAHTKVVPPVAPNPSSSVNEELADPRDSGALRTKHTKSTSARSTQPPQPSNVTMPPSSSTTDAPRALPRSRPEPMLEPLSAPPQQDIFTLPTPPSADSSTSDAPADSPDLAPAPNSGGGEQSSVRRPDLSPPPGATWWTGSLRTTPLAVGESGPGADEYAASRERQALVGEWLMRQSRSAAPQADTASVFPYVPSAAEGGLNVRASACPNVPPADTDRAPIAASTRGREATSTRESSADADRERAATPASETASVPSARDTASEPDATPVSIVWEGSTVPADRIMANARLLTPQVGRVRAGLRNGHAIEGRLYAVGTGNVWIDTDVGRLVLQRGEIERLEQVATLIDDTQDGIAESTPAPASETHADAVVAADKQSPSSGTAVPSTAKTPAVSPTTPAVPEPPPRVRVRTPGGVFFGQIVAREGSTLTLLTDEGSRITLESDDIEAAPIAKAVVKRDPAPAAKPPASGGNPPQPR